MHRGEGWVGSGLGGLMRNKDTKQRAYVWEEKGGGKGECERPKQQRQTCSHRRVKVRGEDASLVHQHIPQHHSLIRALHYPTAHHPLHRLGREIPRRRTGRPHLICEVLLECHLQALETKGKLIGRQLEQLRGIDGVNGLPRIQCLGGLCVHMCRCEQ